jgi:hypothetical protein
LIGNFCEKVVFSGKIILTEQIKLVLDHKTDIR